MLYLSFLSLIEPIEPLIQPLGDKNIGWKICVFFFTFLLHDVHNKYENMFRLIIWFQCVFTFGPGGYIVKYIICLPQELQGKFDTYILISVVLSSEGDQSSMVIVHLLRLANLV